MFDQEPDPLSDCMEAYGKLQKEHDLRRDQLKIALATIVILKRALALSSQCVADMEDQLEIECFGADVHKSVVIASAAAEFGLANQGDSAYSLESLTAEQALRVLSASNKKGG